MVFQQLKLLMLHKNILILKLSIISNNNNKVLIEINTFISMFQIKKKKYRMKINNI